MKRWRPFLLFCLISFLSRLDSSLESASLCRALMSNKTNMGKLSQRHQQNGHKPSVSASQKWERTSPSRRNTTPVLPAVSRPAGDPVGGLGLFSPWVRFSALDPLETRPKVLCVIFMRGKGSARNQVCTCILPSAYLGIGY